MATINYLVVGKKNHCNILLRFKNGRKLDVTTSTELKVIPKNWSKPKQKVKNTSGELSKDFINSKLSALKTYIFDEFNIDNSSGITIDKSWLVLKVSTFFDRQNTNNIKHSLNYFTDYIQVYIDDSPFRLKPGSQKPISQATIKKYKTTKQKIFDYEAKHNVKLEVKDVNLDFYKNFIQLLKIDQNINLNTIGSYISSIKTIVRDAKLNGVEVHEHIEHPNFYTPKIEAESIVLNNKEIKKVAMLNLNKYHALDNARDLFIIGLRTGLRVSDFLRLTMDNFTNGLIEIETQKTSKKVKIPLHEDVKQVLSKHNGLPRMISDQKFNKHIKKICEMADINELVVGSKLDKETKRKKHGTYEKWELVTSHICRRSFATNLYGKVPNGVIMGVTGHRTEREFLKYIKVTPSENAKMIEQFWDNEYLKTKINE
ncbi:integrase [Flavobacteriaceae bacterium 144Ye]|nr:integrase [Flavobacteriaceae bacterium 144Ye]